MAGTGPAMTIYYSQVFVISWNDVCIRECRAGEGLFNLAPMDGMPAQLLQGDIFTGSRQEVAEIFAKSEPEAPDQEPTSSSVRDRAMSGMR